MERRPVKERLFAKVNRSGPTQNHMDTPLAGYRSDFRPRSIRRTTMSGYVIVIPNKYPDVIQPLLESLKKYEPDTHVIIVADGHDNGYGHELIQYPFNTFRYARAVNLGIVRAMNIGHQPNIVLLNDDCVLLGEHTFHTMQNQMELVQPVGLISPLIKGGVGNPGQRWHEKAKWWRQFETMKMAWGIDPVCFPCVMLKRDMVEHIGLLSENIPGYGRDDNDYCIRARLKGWWTAISGLSTVQHGDGTSSLETGRGKSWSTSFARQLP